MGLRDSLPRFLNHPYYVLLVTVVGLISLPLSIYLYFEGRQTRDLVFAVDPVRTVIARSGRPSELKVEFRGEIIKGDVIGAQVALWNQGKGSIHASDILTPLEIRLNPPTPILQVSVSKASRSVIALALGNDVEMLRQGRIPISFRILERDDGGNVQIIYAGASDIQISIVGVVEGTGAPRNLPATGQRSSQTERPSYRWQTVARLFPSVYAFAIVVVEGRRVIRRLQRKDRLSNRDKGFIAIHSLIIVAAISLAVFAYWWFPYVPTPPFGY